MYWALVIHMSQTFSNLKPLQSSNRPRESLPLSACLAMGNTAAVAEATRPAVYLWGLGHGLQKNLGLNMDLATGLLAYFFLVDP